MAERKKRNISITVESVYNTTAYGEVLVLDVKSYKEITVRFLSTGNEQMVSGGSLIIGQIVDKKLFNDTKLMYIGKICSTKSYGDVEVISIDAQKCSVKFIDTGNVQTVEIGNLRKGLIKDKILVEEICKYKVGSTHKTNSSGYVEVIENTNAHNLIIKFNNTGNIQKVHAGNLKKGNVSDIQHYEDNYPYKVGDILDSNNYGAFTLIEFINNRKDKVSVKFHDTGTIVKTTLSQVAIGAVKDPNSTVFVPKELGDNRFCVYLHKDSSGIIRYVGQGLYKRASAILGRNKKWNEVFKYQPPIVEYVKTGISKTEAETLEQELIEKYADTIVNCVRTYSGAREMDYEIFNEYFYVSESSVSGLKWKINYNGHKAGDDAYDYITKGYYVVYLNKSNYLVHRVIWLLVNGEISKDMVVDHKNRVRGDNCISNLSLVSMSHNMRNRVLPLPSSGYRNIEMNISKTGIIRFTVNYTKPLHDSRDKISFSTITYLCPFKAFMDAYNYRDKLIAQGTLLDIIKQGEKPIEDMQEYLLSLNKEEIQYE